MMGAGLFDPTAPFQETNEKSAFKIAKLLDYKENTKDKNTLLAFLKKLRAVQFIESQRKYITEEFREVNI